MNFQNKFYIYNQYADVQREVAKGLISFIDENTKDKKIESVFEIGCGTGIFTRCFLEKYSPSSLILNDYFDTKEYFQNISYNSFYQGNIEEKDIPTADIIVSSSALQWIGDLEKVISRIAKTGAIFSFSIFTYGNLQEIKNHFDISLNYHKIEKIYEILRKYFKNIAYKSQTIKKKFDTPLDALRHLKNTGVTGFKKTTVGKIRAFKEDTLTYEIGYFYCSR